MKYNRILINSILVYIFITFWFTWIYLEYTKQNETSTNKTNFDICEYFDNKKAAGQFCFDLCIEKIINKNTKAYLNSRYHLINYLSQSKNYKSSLICLSNDKYDTDHLLQ